MLKRGELLDAVKASNDPDGSVTCPVCHRTFSRRTNALAHIRRVHWGEKRRRRQVRWTCELCDKELSSKRSYQEHLNTHSKRKPFLCSHCPYAGNSDVTLRRHYLRNHANVDELGYPCPHCTAIFAESNGYQQHVRSEHPGFSGCYTCPSEACRFGTFSRRFFEEHVGRHKLGEILAPNGQPILIRPGPLSTFLTPIPDPIEREILSRASRGRGSHSSLTTGPVKFAATQRANASRRLVPSPHSAIKTGSPIGGSLAPGLLSKDTVTPKPLPENTHLVLSAPQTQQPVRRPLVIMVRKSKPIAAPSTNVRHNFLTSRTLIDASSVSVIAPSATLGKPEPRDSVNQALGRLSQRVADDVAQSSSFSVTDASSISVVDSSSVNVTDSSSVSVSNASCVSVTDFSSVSGTDASFVSVSQPQVILAQPEVKADRCVDAMTTVNVVAMATDEDDADWSRDGEAWSRDEADWSSDDDDDSEDDDDELDDVVPKTIDQLLAMDQSESTTGPNEAPEAETPVSVEAEDELPTESEADDPLLKLIFGVSKTDCALSQGLVEMDLD